MKIHRVNFGLDHSGYLNIWGATLHVSHCRCTCGRHKTRPLCAITKVRTVLWCSKFTRNDSHDTSNKSDEWKKPRSLTTQLAAQLMLKESMAHLIVSSAYHICCHKKGHLLVCNENNIVLLNYFIICLQDKPAEVHHLVFKLKEWSQCLSNVSLSTHLARCIEEKTQGAVNRGKKVST